MNSSGIEEHGIHRIRKRGPKKDSSTASNQNKKHCPQNYKHACNKHSNDEAAKIVKANNHSDEMQCDKQVAAVEEETWKLGKGIGPRSELDEFDKANQSADDEGMLEEMTLEGKMVVVENLSLHVEEDMLLREFSQYVFIEFLGLHCFLPHEMEAYSKKDPKTSQSDDAQNSYMACIAFGKEESAKAALAHNMVELDGKQTHVRSATLSTREDLTTPFSEKSRSLLIENLPFDVKDEEILERFKDVEGKEVEVEALRIARDNHTHIGKGFAYILFKSKLLYYFLNVLSSYCSLSFPLAF